jgi:PAS domain S-box-containing protein
MKSRINQILLKSGILSDALEQAEDRFYKAFHASPSAMSITTLDGRYVDANDALLSIVEYDRASIIGRRVQELGIWAVEGDRDALIAVLLREGSAKQVEGMIRARGGALRDVNVDMELIVEHGQSCILTILQDVTEQKRSETALRASEERYRVISELISDFAYSFVAGPDGALSRDWITAAFSRITDWPAEGIVSFEDLLAIAHPADAQAAAAHVAAALSGVQDKRELRIVTSRGAVRWLRFQTIPVVDPETGIVVRLYGAAEDVTDRVKAYQTLEQRVAERTRELSVLLDISYNLASTQELRPLLGLILSELKKLIDYTGAAVFKIDGGDLVFLEYRGPMPRDEVMRMRIPLRDAADCRKVMEQRVPVIIGDLWAGTERGSFYQRPASGLYPAFGYAHSWLGLPLISKGHLVGILRLDHLDRDHFTEQYAELAMTIANQAAIAIENAQLYERALQLAAIEERQRIARELHDSVSQALYGINLGVQTALQRLREGSDKLEEPLLYVQSLSEAGMVEMRALLYELRPDALESEGLIAGLEKHAAALRARHGIEVATELCPEPKVSMKVKETLYRIAREALNNIVKHAQASSARLSLASRGGSLHLEIEDDGLGFDRQAVAPGHLGLRGMAERAGQLGGTFEVTSSPGKGTLVHASVPIGT